jgi:hypothetical protein
MKRTGATSVIQIGVFMCRQRSKLDKIVAFFASPCSAFIAFAVRFRPSALPSAMSPQTLLATYHIAGFGWRKKVIAVFGSGGIAEACRKSPAVGAQRVEWWNRGRSWGTDIADLPSFEGCGSFVRVTVAPTLRHETLANGQGLREIKNVRRRHFRLGEGRRR